MYGITILISIILSLFSTSVMSYVALATPVGPWIAPVLVCVALLFAKFCRHFSCIDAVYAVCAGSIGGIIATACAFSFPTLYFLDPMLFNTWMESPLFFSGLLFCFSFIAGLFGMFISDCIENSLFDTHNLSFPISQLVQKMFVAQDQLQKSYELLWGLGASVFFYIIQIFLHYIMLPRIVMQLDSAPMVLAIGFVTGHVIALPLAVGAISVVCLLNPVKQFLFPFLSHTECVLAFCAGIVFLISATSLVLLSQQLIHGRHKDVRLLCTIAQILRCCSLNMIIGCCVLLGAFFSFFSYFEMPVFVQFFLLVCSVITTYQIAAISGRIGLALLGRFATFVMVPALFFFNLTYVHIVFIATFVEISGGVAADVLTGRKIAQLMGASRVTMRRYQMLGLIASSLAVGIIFWFLINHFGLGSSELFAYRAQMRQLLVQAQQFNYLVMIIGGLFGLLLQYIGLNPMLVLGGIVMPFNITIGLVIGGLIALWIQEKEEWYPFWSGIFAGNSLIMLLRSILNLL